MVAGRRSVRRWRAARRRDDGAAPPTFVPAPLLDLSVDAVVGYLEAQRLHVVVRDAGSSVAVDATLLGPGWRVVATIPAPEQLVPVGSIVQLFVSERPT